jgi:hypothetical protein
MKTVLTPGVTTAADSSFYSYSSTFFLAKSIGSSGDETRCFFADINEKLLGYLLYRHWNGASERPVSL